MTRPALEPVFTTCTREQWLRRSGTLSSRVIPPHVIGHAVDAAPFRDLPPLRPEQQREAIRLVRSPADDPTFCGEMMFEPGDTQCMNDPVMVRSRTAGRASSAAASPVTPARASPRRP